jgi:hypothetical protein
MGMPWAWVGGQCPGQAMQCAMATTCGDCTPMNGCGFCFDSMNCLAGTGMGPTTGTCAHWAWVPGDCNPADGGPTDGGPTDSGPTDSGTPDAGHADGGTG